MRIPISILMTLAVMTALLQGCAGVIIGGAATGAAVVHDRRTAGTVIEDQAIELKGRKALSNDPEIRQKTHINITSYNNVMLLTGEAPSDELRSRAETLVRRIPKVKRVHNVIRIAAPSALVSRSSDTLITAKVKTQLMGLGLEDFDPTRTKVVTEDGTVYLMGLLRPAEADAVVERTRRVAGVQRVVKVFEIID